MHSVSARQALLPSGWASDVSVDFANDGRIAAVRQNTPHAGHLVDVLLPAPVNAHSHAFQRAMAGLTERRGPNPQDSFWTWRDLMFRFLDHLTPDHVEAIATFVQMEMLEAGYATNVEFHYLHHRPGGTPYDAIAEMSERIVAASMRSGIGLCLLPVHYERGGCDGRDLAAGQIRFGNTWDRFMHLHDRAAAAIKQARADATLGVAPHSLRAVAQSDLIACADRFEKGPIHMHLAEQTAEVEEVRHHWGARPVEWALDNMALDARWCLIHCTQMTPEETKRLAQSGAVAGLCPITENSLGDGIFDAQRWTAAAGAFAIGSDSNIRISLAEELRTLEYSQRLRDGARAVLATPDRSTGRYLFDEMLRGGAQAAGRLTGQIAPAYWADLIALDTTRDALWGRTGDTILDSWIFAGDDRVVRDVWSGGCHMVKDGLHVHRSEIAAAYRRTINALRDRL